MLKPHEYEDVSERNEEGSVAKPKEIQRGSKEVKKASLFEYASKQERNLLERFRGKAGSVARMMLLGTALANSVACGRVGMEEPEAPMAATQEEEVPQGEAMSDQDPIWSTGVIDRYEKGALKVNYLDSDVQRVMQENGVQIDMGGQLSVNGVQMDFIGVVPGKVIVEISSYALSFGDREQANEQAILMDTAQKRLGEGPDGSAYRPDKLQITLISADGTKENYAVIDGVIFESSLGIGPDAL